MAAEAEAIKISNGPSIDLMKIGVLTSQRCNERVARFRDPEANEQC
jgi:hypothetical protein